MRRPIAVLAAVAALPLLVSCGGPLFYVELVIPEIRVSVPQQAFPASSGADPASWCTPSDPSCLFKDIEYDFGDSIPFMGEKNVTVDLRLTQLAIALDAGTSSLGAVRSVTVKILRPGDPTDFVVAASYVRTDPSPTTISVSGNANVDLGGYLDGSKLVARAEFVYDATTPEFTADVAAKFSLVVKLDYGAYLF